jgi:hypothetical protein
MDPSNNPRAAPIRSAIHDSRFSPLRYIRGVNPGVKRDQQIVMPVRDVYCLYSLLDRVAATAAWRRENRHDGLEYQRMDPQQPSCEATTTEPLTQCHREAA